MVGMARTKDCSLSERLLTFCGNVSVGWKIIHYPQGKKFCLGWKVRIKQLQLRGDSNIPFLVWSDTCIDRAQQEEPGTFWSNRSTWGLVWACVPIDVPGKSLIENTAVHHDWRENVTSLILEVLNSTSEFLTIKINWLPPDLY